MTTLKTRENDADVEAFIDGVENQTRCEDARVVTRWMQEITGEPAKMWGGTMIGFGHYDYKYASGKEGRWFITGLSPRKQNLTLYIMPGFSKYDALLERLGKHKLGKSCLYINKLKDVDEAVLKELIGLSVDHMREKYPS